MLINGVVAKATWQHVFAAPAEKQPPLRITAILDNSYRTQLGLDINDLVQGDVGVEVTVSHAMRDGERHVHLRADLVNAELVLDSVAWRKPRGRRERVRVRRRQGHAAPIRIELLNVRLVGDDVAIDGWMGIGADNKVQGVPLPQLLAQCRHQPRDARQGAPRRRLGGDGEGPHLRRPRPLPVLLRRRPPATRTPRSGRASTCGRDRRRWSASPTPRCAT